MTTSTSGSSGVSKPCVKLFEDAVEVQRRQMKMQATAETFPATCAQSVGYFKNALTPLAPRLGKHI